MRSSQLDSSDERRGGVRIPRLSLVTDDLGSGPEGTVTRNAVLGFSRLGRSCEVVLLDGSSEDTDVEFASATVRLGLGSGAGHRPAAVRALTKHLRVSRPDGVVAYPAGLIPVCALAAHRARVPLVAWEGNFVTGLAAELRLHQRLLPLTQRIAYRHIHAAAAKAPAIAADLRQRLPRRVEVAYVPNSVDPEALRLSARVAGVERRGFTLCSLGLLNSRKGFDLLLDALLRVAPRLPDDWRLVAIGDHPRPHGSAQRRAARRIESLRDRSELRDRVETPGHLTNPFGALASADLFVHAARFDPCPNAVLEAMALERPIVATDSPGATADLLDGGRAGVLCPPEDPVALGEAIVSLAGDGEARRRLGEAAAARALTFTPERSAGGLADLLAESGDR